MSITELFRRLLGTEKNAAGIREHPIPIAPNVPDCGLEPKPELVPVTRRKTENSTGKNPAPTYVVYTSILGAYDSLPELKQIDPDIRYICFTDTPELFADNPPWTIVPITSVFRDRKIMNGYLKTNAHILFGQNCISVWVDGNLNDVNISVKFLEETMKTSPVAVSPHLVRDTVAAEIEVVTTHHLEPVCSASRIFKLFELPFPRSPVA